MPDPYRILGLPRNATDDDVRQAFQTLAKKLHPDSSGTSRSAAQFQEVKEAYDILRDKDARHHFDSRRILREGSYEDPAEAERLRERAAEFRRRYQNSGGAHFHRRAMRAVEQLLRPRTLVWLPFAAALSWYLTGTIAPIDDAAGGTSGDGRGARVPAWFNPSSRRWETPAPWSPLFQAQRHTLKLMPRGEVHVSTPPMQGEKGQPQQQVVAEAAAAGTHAAAAAVSAAEGDQMR